MNWDHREARTLEVACTRLAADLGDPNPLEGGLPLTLDELRDEVDRLQRKRDRWKRHYRSRKLIMVRVPSERMPLDYLVEQALEQVLDGVRLPPEAVPGTEPSGLAMEPR